MPKTHVFVDENQYIIFHIIGYALAGGAGMLIGRFF